MKTIDQVESVEIKKSKNGKSYALVKLYKFQSKLIDWKPKKYQDGKIKAEDFVEVEYKYRDGFPEITKIEVTDKRPPIGREKRITRMACLNSAIEIVKISYGTFCNEKEITADGILKTVEQIAEELEKWVERNDSENL